MNRLFVSAMLVTTVFCFSCKTKKDESAKNNDLENITFSENSENKIVEVFANGKPFTTFRWTDDIYKPVLYPVFAASGTEITRGFPIQPKPGERADHPHQIGMWLTYGNVNGSDFWGNGSKGLGTFNSNGGKIVHIKSESFSKSLGEGILVTAESWIDSAGIKILNENTEYHFTASGKIRIIDRITTLTAFENKVTFSDTKEGMFAIRVARQLELPTKGEIEMYNADGSVSRIKDTVNAGITGNYFSSEGISGDAVWGTRARWMKLDGTIGDEEITIVICDHPKNPNYPTYWHARGYGLFSANPLGEKDFTKGDKTFDFSLGAEQSVTFRYRVVIVSGVDLSDDDLEKFNKEFEVKY